MFCDEIPEFHKREPDAPAKAVFSAKLRRRRLLCRSCMGFYYVKVILEALRYPFLLQMSRSPSPQEHLVKIESLLMQTDKENMNEVSSKNVQALKAEGQQGIQCISKGSKDNKDSQDSHSIRSPKERRKRMRMKRRKKKEKVTKVIQVFCGCSTRFEDHQDALAHTRNYTHTHTHTHTHITCKCQMPRT